jgi:hypothetical protein
MSAEPGSDWPPTLSTDATFLSVFLFLIGDDTNTTCFRGVGNWQGQFSFRKSTDASVTSACNHADRLNRK